MSDFSRFIQEEAYIEKEGGVWDKIFRGLASASEVGGKASGAARAGIGGALGYAGADEGSKATGALQGAATGYALPHMLRFVGAPIKTVQQSWRAMSPATKATQATKRAPGLLEGKPVEDTAGLFSKMWAKMRAGKGGEREFLARTQKHLTEKPHETLTGAFRAGKAKGESGISEVAKELSRRGWTGRGEIGKYMPIGGKGLTAFFGAQSLGVPLAAMRGEATPGDVMAELGGNLGYLAVPGGALAPLATSMAMSDLGRKATEKVLGKTQEGELSDMEQQQLRDYLNSLTYNDMRLYGG